MSRDENVDLSGNASRAGQAGLRLQEVNQAVETFLDAATDACAILEDLDFAIPFVKWLQYQAIPLVEDYEVQIEECEDNASEALKLLQELKDEAASLDGLLLFPDHIDEELDKQIGQDATDAVKADIGRYIAAKLRPVLETGRQLTGLLGKSIERE